MAWYLAVAQPSILQAGLTVEGEPFEAANAEEAMERAKAAAEERSNGAFKGEQLIILYEVGEVERFMV